MVITIGREFGSGGECIGEKLANDLNMKLYDKEILNKVSEESGIDLQVLEEVDEKQEQSFWYTFAMSLYSSEESITSLTEIPTNEKLFIEQAKVIEELAENEDCIIIGRCSNIILNNRKDILNIFVYSSDFDFKVNRKMKYGNFLDRNEAEGAISRIDNERATYYNYFTKQKWGDREGYDLMIDTSKIGVNGAVDLIKEYVKLLQGNKI